MTWFIPNTISAAKSETPQVVQRVDHDERRIHVSMTKDEIKNAPDLDESNRSRDDAFFDRHGGYYGSYGDW